MRILFFFLFAISCQAQNIAPQSLELPPQLKRASNASSGDSPELAAEAVLKKTREVWKMPVLPDSARARTFFGATHFTSVDNVAFSITPNGSALFAEFMSDYLYLGKKIGYARVGFGGLVETQRKNDAPEDNAQTTFTQFLSTGGNGMMYVLIPLSKVSSYHDGYELMRASLLFLPRIGVDIPALNGAIVNPAYNVDSGIEAQAMMRSASKVFQFFGQVRTSFVFGSDDFYRNIGLLQAQQKPFFLGRWTAGVDLASLIRVSITKAFINTADFQESPTILSVQLINRIKK